MKPLLRCIITVCSALLIAGCGSSSEAPAETEPDRTGKYQMSELYSEDGSDLTENLSELESLGKVITIELRDDGTGTYMIFDEEKEITWDETTITTNDETLPIEWDGTTLIIRSGAEDESRMIFLRVPDTQP